MQVFKIIMFFIGLSAGKPIMDEINEKMMSALNNMQKANDKLIEDSKRMPFESLNQNTLGAALDEYIALMKLQQQAMAANYG